MRCYIFELVYNDDVLEDIVEKYVARRSSSGILMLDIDNELQDWFTFEGVRSGNRYMYEEGVCITVQNIKEIPQDEYEVLKEYNMRW